MRSIERYLLQWIMGALTVGAMVVVFVTYLVTLDEMNEVYNADLKNVAEALGTYHHAGIGIDGYFVPRSPVRSDVPDPAEIVTVTWTQEGRRVFSSDMRVALPFMSKEALSHVRVAHEEWIVYTDVSPNGVAQAAQRASARSETAEESASKIILPMTGLVFFVAALMVYALRRGLRPLDLASRNVAQRSATSLTPIATEDIPREITPLVSSINELMSQLSLAFANQRRFLADAAHELRTPVTALRLQLQWLQSATDAASRTEAMAELDAGISRSQRLIEQLLQVARHEPEAEQVKTEAVDLSALVRSVVGTMSIKADQFGIDLGAGGDSHVMVDGDASQLTVLLNNLVENALRYTPEGGVIDVEATHSPGRATLRVVDDGPGIPEAEHQRVFERFYRTDDAAKLARDPGGSGLGLAIVKAIAERHRALISLHLRDSGRGLEVRVVFDTTGQDSAHGLQHDA